MRFIYLLTFEVKTQVSSKKLESVLNKALDWVQLTQTSYLIRSSSDLHKWDQRLKYALDKNRFFIIEVDINNRTGWLPKYAWKWIRDNE